MIGGGDRGFGVVRIAEGPGHVGLAGAHPDFAHEDVLHFNGVVAALDGERDGIHRSLERLQLTRPVSVVIGLGTGDLVINRNRDLGTGISGAPDGGGFALLLDPCRHEPTPSRSWSIDRCLPPSVRAGRAAFRARGQRAQEGAGRERAR